MPKPTQRTQSDFAPQMRVRYIPNHAHGDSEHQDVEYGTVSSVSDKWVFVRFDQQVSVLGWDGATAQACDVGNLTDA